MLDGRMIRMTMLHCAGRDWTVLCWTHARSVCLEQSVWLEDVRAWRGVMDIFYREKGTLKMHLSAIRLGDDALTRSS